MNYRVSVFIPHTHNGRIVPGWYPKEHSLTLRQLRDVATTRRNARTKCRNKCWSPARFSIPHRKNENAIEVCALVYDVDTGATIDQAWDHFLRWGWTFWIHTTHSHTPQVHKFRVVLPLSEPCPAKYYRRLWEAYAPRFADPQAKDIARAYYLPSGPPETYEMRRRDSQQMLGGDWESLPETRDEQKRRYIVEGYNRQPRNDRDLADPRTREALALAMGAQISERSLGPVAHGMKCPKCSRDSVWFPIVPTRIVSAMCSHVGSCRWMGSPRDLA